MWLTTPAPLRFESDEQLAFTRLRGLCHNRLLARLRSISCTERKLAVFRFWRRERSERRKPDRKTASYCVSRKRLAFDHIPDLATLSSLKSFYLSLKSFVLSPRKAGQPQQDRVTSRRFRKTAKSRCRNLISHLIILYFFHHH